ncbi:D-alanyl-D-alanine carboxypeptidase/D-alanyl-D-alanine endopeptidase [Boudabousia marimammalium]|uniref:D-alanyl-D-alanine carboxypeptidase/D-alanyl-D-alanine endopeptidase n=1 Tax=Boudabousia marimammalium TaxID=156892 RepID=UPI0013011074|nr:D-alanyl-D-alanine carboxypeptidase/D-alanyl-D-alanine-endopeptidase [Boudabousia marimammalium]
MRIPSTVPVALSAILILGTIGYAVADAYDVVPGILTNTPIAVEQKLPQMPPLSPTAELPERAINPDAPLPDQAKLKAATEKLNGHVSAAGGRLAISLIDAHTGEPVYSYHEAVPMTPASTTKLFTAFSAIKELDPKATFTTTTALAGNTLFLKSNGDITMAAGETDPQGVLGHAGLATLAHKTAVALRGKVDFVQLVVDDTAIAGPERNPAWTAQDVDDYAGNVTDIAIQQGRRDPNHAKYFSHTALADAAGVFVKALEAEGVTVRGHFSTGAQTPGATVLAEEQSASFGQLLHYMDKTSDNTLAEHFCRLMANPLGATADFTSPPAQIVKQYAAQGLNMEGVVLNDCSGLDRDNRITPQALTAIIKDVLDQKEPQARMALSAFPVASLDGTLQQRLSNSNTAGMVRAKTGSLPSVRSLAGVLRTSSGRDLIFAVMIDDCEKDKVWGMKQRIDEFLHTVVTG